MNRTATLLLATVGALLCSACVIGPSYPRTPDAAELERMSDQALKTCGAGNVKEVNSKSFVCK